MAEHHAQDTVAADHSSLPGHFPGRPIVPGVVLLERVFEAARAWRGPQTMLAGFPAVKFLSPLAPAEIFDIHLQDNGAEVGFSCSCNGRLLAQGRLALGRD